MKSLRFLPRTPRPKKIKTSDNSSELLKEGWASTPVVDDDEYGRSPNGLCVNILDVSGSMSDIKQGLANSIAAVAKTMEAVSPGVSSAVVCYSDFDNETVIEAPDCALWKGKDFADYLNSTSVGGGGVPGCEALNSTLWYVLNDLVPNFRRRFRIPDDEELPVLINVLTDESARMYDVDSGAFIDCCGAGQYDAEAEKKFFEQQWNRKPASVDDFHNAIFENNCWLRVIKFLGHDFGTCGLRDLCKGNAIKYSARDNDRWQMFTLGERHVDFQSLITKFLIKQQVALFKNVHSCLSSLPILQKMEFRELAEYISSGCKESNQPPCVAKASAAKREDLSQRLFRPGSLGLEKLHLNGGMSSNHHILLSNAFDNVSSWTILPRHFASTIQQQQQPFRSANTSKKKVAEVAVEIVGEGNAASCLAMHMNQCRGEETLVHYCSCVGCLKLLNTAAKSEGVRKKYTKLQWAKMFAETLFEPMITDPAMIYACEAIPAEVGAIYHFVTSSNASNKCHYISKVLSRLGEKFSANDTWDMKSMAYDLLRSGKHMKNTNYDENFAIQEIVDNYNAVESIRDMDKFVWLFISEKDLEEVDAFIAENFSGIRPSSVTSKKMSLDEYKRFELPLSYELIQMIVPKVKVVTSPRDIKTRPVANSETCVFSGKKDAVRLMALPVFFGTDEERKTLRDALSQEIFDGAESIADMLFVKQSEVIQKIGCLVNVKLGLTPFGFAGVKAVTAAAANAHDDKSRHGSDMLIGLAEQAIRDYVAVKTGEDMALDASVIKAMNEAISAVGDPEALEDNLCGPMFMHCLKKWASNYRGSSSLVRRIQDFSVLRILSNMNRNGIGQGYQSFASRELLFDDSECTKCSTCKATVPEKETVLAREQEDRMKGARLCLRCYTNQRSGHPIYDLWNKKLSVRGPGDTIDESAILEMKEKKSISDKAKAIVNQLNDPDDSRNVFLPAAAKAAGAVYGMKSLLHKLMTDESFCGSLPSAVSVKCMDCGVVYKMSPLGPAEPRRRKCPWCRYARKIGAMKEEGKALFKKVMEDERPFNRLVVLVHDCSIHQSLDDKQDVTVYERQAREKMAQLNKKREVMTTTTTTTYVSSAPPPSTTNVPSLFSSVLKSTVSEEKVEVAGHGPVKTGRRIIDGGETIPLHVKVNWLDFNTDVVKPLIGYSLTSVWKNWDNFTTGANKNDIWKASEKLSSRAASVHSKIPETKDEVDKVVRLLVNTRKN